MCGSVRRDGRERRVAVQRVAEIHHFLMVCPRLFRNNTGEVVDHKVEPAAGSTPPRTLSFQQTHLSFTRLAAILPRPCLHGAARVPRHASSNEVRKL